MFLVRISYYYIPSECSPSSLFTAKILISEQNANFFLHFAESGSLFEIYLKETNKRVKNSKQTIRNNQYISRERQSQKHALDIQYTFTQPECTYHSQRSPQTPRCSLASASLPSSLSPPQEEPGRLSSAETTKKMGSTSNSNTFIPGAI